MIRPTRAERSNPFAAKLAKITNSNFDDLKTQDALNVLCEFYTSNSVAARRSLRSDLERKSLEINKKFLHAMGDKMDSLEETIQSLNTSCDLMNQKIKSAQEQSNQLTKRTDELKAKKSSCVARRTIVDAFMKKFTLSEEQVNALTSPSPSIRADFFEALEHLTRIKEDCNVLLMSEHKEAGTDIIEKMSQYQEEAFARLFKWTMAECRSMNRETPEITPNFKSAMKAIRQRPALFVACVEEITQIRKNAITRSFLDALTRGGPGGTPKPIEMHAHDPLRYIGDMLAWIHQAVASERELLEGLFLQRDDIGNVDSRRTSVSDSAFSPLVSPESPFLRGDKDVVLQVLDKTLEGTCRPTRGRIEQVLLSRPESGATLPYKISNLIQFYSSTVEKVMGPSSQLSQTLKDMIELAMKSFFDTLNEQASQMLRFVEDPSSDLLPPKTVKESIVELKEILALFESSMLSPESRGKDVEKVISSVLDPLLQLCVLSSTNLGLIDKATYMLNCLHFINTSLALYPFASTHIKAIETQIEAQIDVLTFEMLENLLKESKLGPILSIIENNENNTPLSLIPDMHYRHISEVMSWFDMYLGTLGPEDVSSAITRKLSNSKLARRILKNAYKSFLQSYKKINDEIMDPKNKYEFPATMLPRTVNEVELLLHVDVGSGY